MTEILFARLGDTIQSVTNDTNVTGTLVPGALGGTLTLGWTGTLSLARGGTGANLTTSAATGDTYYYSGGALHRLGIGTSGQALTVSGGVPAWGTIAPGLVIGTTTITSGTTGRVLYDNGGVVGELSVSGSGNVVLVTSATLVTPTLGAATATSINGLTITSSTGTLTITNAKTLSVSNSLTLAGTDSTTMTFPGSSDTVVTLGATQTLTNKTLTSTTDVLGGVTMGLGSDAKGDIYYNSGSSNVLSRLAIGTSGYVLTVSSGVPAWASAGAASITVGSSAISGGGSGYLLFDNSSGNLGADSHFTYAGAGGVVTLTPAANTAQPFLITGGSTTGSGTSTLGISVVGTLNTTGNVDGAAFFANITNTASGSSTKMFDLQIGGTSKIYMDKDSVVVPATYTIPSGFMVNTGKTAGITSDGTALILGANLLNNITFAITNNAFQFSSAMILAWNSTNSAPATADTGLSRDAAGVIDVGNGTLSDVSGTMKMKNITLGAVANFHVYTVAALPSGQATGAVALVSDATSNVVIGSGGGSAYALVTYNGSAWVAV